MKPHSLELVREVIVVVRTEGLLEVTQWRIILVAKHLQGTLSASIAQGSQSTHVGTLSLEVIQRLLGALITLG